MIPDGLFLVRVDKAQYRWHGRKHIGRDEIEDKNLVGLRGVIKISHAVLNGALLPNLNTFAPASQWQELTTVLSARKSSPETR
jgi:hypothetical protein